MSLSYDPLGRLRQTTTGGITTDFLYDGDALVAEYNGSTLLRRYAHGPGVDEPLVWYEGSNLNDRRWPITDNQGSIIATSEALGQPSAPYTYGPYGEPGSWGTQSTASRFRYTGQAALPEVQLYHYKARVYDPVLGRFLQTDPVGYEDDLNLYAYVRNDPLNNADPTGRWIESGLDIAFIAADIADISENGLTWESGLALGADVVGLALPGGTGLGLGVRGGFRAADALSDANRATDAARATERVTHTHFSYELSPLKQCVSRKRDTHSFFDRDGSSCKLTHLVG